MPFLRTTGAAEIFLRSPNRSSLPEEVGCALGCGRFTGGFKGRRWGRGRSSPTGANGLGSGTGTGAGAGAGAGADTGSETGAGAGASKPKSRLCGAMVSAVGVKMTLPLVMSKTPTFSMRTFPLAFKSPNTLRTHFSISSFASSSPKFSSKAK